MKALTLHQPWASLVALGVKTIETRSWRTNYRGRIAIHAGRTKADPRDPAWEPLLDAPGSVLLRADVRPLPLGAIVATAELVDCVPMGGEHSFRSAGWDGEEQEHEHDTVLVITDGSYDRPVLCLDRPNERPRILDVSDQLPFGVFEPGRWAWILDGIVPCDPIPARGKQGLWEWTP